MAIKLHIAESNFVTREGLKAVFDRQAGIDIVGISDKSEQLKDEILDSNPQVLLINYDTYDFHASDVMQSLRLIPGLRVVGMTPSCDSDTLRKLLDAGLCAHLMSDCDQDEIVDSVISSARGEKFFCGKVLGILNASKGMNSEYSCEPVTISERELEILQLVAQGLTTKQIAEKVYLSFHTVMTHRKNMMRKLGINNTAGLIIYAVRENLISPNRFLFSESNSTN